MVTGKLFVGTSGWTYKGWAGTFYPPEVKPAHHLEFYTTRFETVEINATFYRLPLPSTVVRWRQRSPSSFVFAVKGSRFITQMKKLQIEPASLKKFFKAIKLLKEKCGPILWQLPPQLGFNGERLDRFLKMTPKKYRHAVEFRHPSWYEHEKTFEILQRHQAAHVSISSMRMPVHLAVTADFVYVRFHGLLQGAAHDYTREEMEPLANHCRHCLAKGLVVFAYFNNDLNTRAPNNATVFREMVNARSFN